MLGCFVSLDLKKDNKNWKQNPLKLAKKNSEYALWRHLIIDKKYRPANTSYRKSCDSTLHMNFEKLSISNWFKNILINDWRTLWIEPIKFHISILKTHFQYSLLYTIKIIYNPSLCIDFSFLFQQISQKKTFLFKISSIDFSFSFFVFDFLIFQIKISTKLPIKRKI